jgi:hypothetical protein
MNTYQLEKMRPTLIVGSGGTGGKILTFLKRILVQQFDAAWQTKIRLLAFDTAEEALTAQTAERDIQLEPGAEIVNIGNVPVPNIVRNLEGLDAIRERLGAAMAALPPVVLRSGAKQIRPFGLLSLLWNYKRVSQELEQAIWTLAGRDQQESGTLSQQQGINVFICGSLVGGTGSGTFLDLAYLIRAYFNELGAQAEFCHLTGIGVLPQAFHGVSGPNLYPNTAAALEELNHLMIKGGFSSRYPDGRTITSQEAPFNLFYLIDGVDERGQTWPGITDVCVMIAEGLFLQMGSQLGRKGENAFDNMDEALIEQTAEGDGTFLGGFGLAYLEFDADQVAARCTDLFLHDLIEQGWLRPVQADAVESQSPALRKGLTETALNAALAWDDALETEMRVDLSLPEWLFRKRPDEVTAEAGRYVREYGHARIGEKLIPRVQQNGLQQAEVHQERLQAWLDASLLDPELGVAHIITTISHLRRHLAEEMAQARKQIADAKQQLARQAEAVTELETALARAASSFPLGRNGRIRQALTRYFQTAETWYETQFQHQLARSRLQVWADLDQWLAERRAVAVALRNRLTRLAAHLSDALPHQLEALAAGQTARLSLADESYVRALYQRYRPTWADVQSQIGSPEPLYTLSTSNLHRRLHRALSPSFAPVAAMSVEDAIQERTEEVTPRARRQRLFQLAAPSWNVDRARLPDGGAGLVRLEVMGVPDETNTLFADEPMLVSTRDPHRLTALVVVAGAPQSALQQYQLYRQALERVRSQRPIYVLPSFLASADQARLAFALGSIFGFIYSQGTFFYYRPADQLHNPIKLANGLNNAIESFASQDGLVQTVMDRVEGRIAQLGLRDAIEILTDYYGAVPDGGTSLDEQLRELKRLVRAYTDDLRRIDDFHAGVPVNGDG